MARDISMSGTTGDGRRVAVLGAGSWGTALAISLASTGHHVTLWARRKEAADTMNERRRNPSYLPNAVLPDNVRITDDLAIATKGASLWIMATPSHAVRALAERTVPHVTDDIVIVSVAKGIERNTLMTTTQVLDDVLDDVPADRLAVLYGPSHAEEVAEGHPTTLVVASTASATAEYVQETFISPRLRVYISEDVLGVEIGGSVKNIMAIAAGIGDGIGYGDNSKAALITRGIAEIRRLGLALGARPVTFSGLSGIGDLVVTCFSRHSRNRHLGEQIGKGRSLEQAEREMQMVAEGVRTTRAVHELAQERGIEMPITEAVYEVLFEGKSPHLAVQELMTREAKREDWLPEELQEASS